MRKFIKTFAFIFFFLASCKEARKNHVVNNKSSSSNLTADQSKDKSGADGASTSDEVGQLDLTNVAMEGTKPEGVPLLPIENIEIFPSEKANVALVSFPRREEAIMEAMEKDSAKEQVLTTNNKIQIFLYSPADACNQSSSAPLDESKIHMLVDQFNDEDEIEVPIDLAIPADAFTEEEKKHTGICFRICGNLIKGEEVSKEIKCTPDVSKEEVSSSFGFEQKIEDKKEDKKNLVADLSEKHEIRKKIEELCLSSKDIFQAMIESIKTGRDSFREKEKDNPLILYGEHNPEDKNTKLLRQSLLGAKVADASFCATAFEEGYEKAIEEEIRKKAVLEKVKADAEAEEIYVKIMTLVASMRGDYLAEDGSDVISGVKVKDEQQLELTGALDGIRGWFKKTDSASSTRNSFSEEAWVNNPLQGSAATSAARRSDTPTAPAAGGKAPVPKKTLAERKQAIKGAKDSMDATKQEYKGALALYKNGNKNEESAKILVNAKAKHLESKREYFHQVSENALFLKQRARAKVSALDNQLKNLADDLKKSGIIKTPDDILPSASKKTPATTSPLLKTGKSNDKFYWIVAGVSIAAITAAIVTHVLVTELTKSSQSPGSFLKNFTKLSSSQKLAQNVDELRRLGDAYRKAATVKLEAATP